MDTEIENRVLIFSELLEKIKDTERPMTLFELTDLFDSNQQTFDLMFYGIPGLSYNHAKKIITPIDYRLRAIPVITDMETIPRKVVPGATNGIKRFVLNNGESDGPQVYNLIEKTSFSSEFQSVLYSEVEENRFFKRAEEPKMEKEVKEIRERINELLPIQAISE